MSGTAAVIEGRGAMAASLSEPRRPRVWLLTNAPSPYQVELLSAVQATGDVDLAVRFMRTPAGSALDEVPGGTLNFCELQSFVPRQLRDEFRLHPGAVWETAWGDYDAYVLSGLYTSVTFLTCALLLSLRGKPWGVWLERPRVAQFQAIERGGSGGPVRRMLRRVKQSVLRRLLRRAVKVIGIGSAAVRTYQELGASPDKLLMLPYCCDGARFERVDEAAVAEVRRRYQLEGKTVFLFSGQMIERKGVDVVLAAFQKLAAERDDVALLLGGDHCWRRTAHRR